MISLGWNRDRIRAGAAVGIVHALLGYALITGLGAEVAHSVGTTLKLFDVPAPPPPVPPPVLAPDEAAKEAPAPPDLVSKAAPVVAPPPKIRLKRPPPLPTAIKKAPLPGTDRTAGSAAIAGPGTGAGGFGDGTGGGGSGTGGGAARAVRIAGSLGNSDYPRAALRAGIEGTVSVRFIVGVDGGVSGCAVTRSSGHAELDSLTCSLIERRFRYRPARNGAGEPVAEPVRKTYDWILPFRRLAGGP